MFPGFMVIIICSLKSNSMGGTYYFFFSYDLTPTPSTPKNNNKEEEEEETTTKIAMTSEALPWILGNGGGGIYFRGTGDQKLTFEGVQGNKDNIGDQGT